MIIVGNDEQFRRFCAALKLDDIAEDPRFAHNEARLRHVDALEPLIEQALADRTMAECQALLDAAGVPVSPINNLAQVFADPQVLARDMIRDIAHRDGSTVRVLANPIRMSRTPPDSNRPPPQLGEHTDEVTKEVGCGHVGAT